jgi:hypothetical protein
MTDLRHYLIITLVEEDTGQDGYVEELEWEIEHDPNCKFSVYDTTAFPTVRHYECAVGEEIGNVGLDGLEDDWQSLEPGRYEIEHWTEGYYNHQDGTMEYDSGLNFVEAK